MTRPHTIQASAFCTVELTRECFARLSRLITSELGIKMPESKLATIQNRLQRRVRELNLASFEEYEKHLFSHGSEERVHFLDAVTTNKTDFFREPSHFEFLRQSVLPQARDPVFKIWSAGCSSGEEPYTLAMVLEEYARERGFGFRFAIMASDVSTRMLEIARKGVYAKTAIHPVPPLLRSRYLLESKDRSRSLVRVSPALRKHVRFHFLNLNDSGYHIRNHFEAIFFRNVLIYFDPPVQAAIVRRLCRHLAPGGYLLISHSESLMGLDVPVQLVKPSIYRTP